MPVLDTQENTVFRILNAFPISDDVQDGFTHKQIYNAIVNLDLAIFNGETAPNNIAGALHNLWKSGKITRIGSRKSYRYKKLFNDETVLLDEKEEKLEIERRDKKHYKKKSKKKIKRKKRIGKRK